MLYSALSSDVQHLEYPEFELGQPHLAAILHKYFYFALPQVAYQQLVVTEYIQRFAFADPRSPSGTGLRRWPVPHHVPVLSGSPGPYVTIHGH